jgi:hypothetical protein
MINPAVKDFISGVVLGTTPGVTRPTVKAPSPFDNEERMDISDRFRPTPDYTNPASYSSAGGSSDDGGGTSGYSGSLKVTGMSGYVDDNFVGMDKYLGAAISPLGFNPLIAAGSAISKKNLQNIQMSMLGGEKGYSVGMVNGKIVGVSPGPFGGYVLSGVLPEGMTADQRRKLINDLLDLNPTTEVAGGKLDPDGPSSGYSEGTATDDVIELIESGVPPEAAAYDYTGFLDDSENAVADTGAGFTGRPDDAAGPTSPVSPSYAGGPSDPYGGPGQPGSSAPSPTSSNGFVTDPKILDALTNPGKYNEDLIDSSGPYGTVDDPTATVSLTTVTDASPPPPSSPPPDFVTYVPPPDDDDDDQPSGNQYGGFDSTTVQEETSAMEDAYQEAAFGSPPDDSDDDSGGGGKIVCTAMNQAYGFGSFRQAIWLAHSRDMAPEYQAGYHAIFQPLVTYGYGGVTKPRKFVRNILEGIARRRTADIWMQKKGKRHPIGRIERAFWEPVCYAVGRIVLCLKK